MDTTDERPARRYPYGCASCFTVIGSLVLFIVLTLARCSSEPPTPSAQPTVSPPVAVAGSLVIGTDDRTLIYTPGRFCADAQLTAAESADRVVLALAYTSASHRGCDVWGMGGVSTRALLAAPLRGRGVFDAVTGAAIPVFHARDALRVPLHDAAPPQAPSSQQAPSSPLRFPSSSPWTPPPTPPVSPLDEWIRSPAVSTGEADFGGPLAATMVQRHPGIDAKTRTTSGAVLVLIATTGTWHPDPSTPTTPVTVRGHPGQAAPGIVVWTENGFTFALRIDFPQHAPRPTGQLIALAALLSHDGWTIP